MTQYMTQDGDNVINIPVLRHDFERCGNVL